MLGFECNEWGATNYDEHDMEEGAEHVWPVWGGIGFCPEISERNKGVLFIKPAGGAINWNVLGRYDRVQANHQDHLFPLYSPIVRSSGLYSGPCAWHTTPEPVSDLLRDGKGERALLCGGGPTGIGTEVRRNSVAHRQTTFRSACKHHGQI